MLTFMFQAEIMYMRVYINTRIIYRDALKRKKHPHTQEQTIFGYLFMKKGGKSKEFPTIREILKGVKMQYFGRRFFVDNKIGRIFVNLDIGTGIET